MTEYVAKSTPQITIEQIERLKTLFPECVSEGKINFDLLKATLGQSGALADENAYSFSWAGKSEAFTAIQTPSAASLKPVPEESVNWDETQNIFIEGENLEVLKLLYKSYFGKIKMIYIDPPYNTGNDFIYKDDYSQPKRAYLEKTGQMDAEGNQLTTNPETGGRYHSDWLTMMYPRLFLARQLLREDGVIFVSIDDHEVHHLRLLMNEIFGEENFVSQIIWQHSIQGKNDVKGISLHHNYILIYSHSTNFIPEKLARKPEHNVAYSNPDDDSNGPWRSGDVRSPNFRENLRFDINTPSGKLISPPKYGWRWSEESINEKIKQGEIIFSDDETRIIRKIYLKDQDGRVPESIWFGKQVGTTREASGNLKDLFDGESPFDTPKPVSLIRRMMKIAGIKKGDIILDFFGGSGTTGQAVLEENITNQQNINFLLIQIDEKITDDKNHKKRKFESVSEISKERLHRVVNSINNDKNQPQKKLQFTNRSDLGFRVYKLSSSTFRQWESSKTENIEDLERQLTFFDSGLEEDVDPKHVIYEVLLKEGFQLNANLRELDFASNKVVKVTDPDNPGSLFYISLDERVLPETIVQLSLDKQTKFICLDTALDDSLKVNLSMTCILKVI